MKIYFFITSSDYLAKGGHFRSCLTIAKSLNKEVNVEIINLGLIKSPVFEGVNVNVTFFKVNLFSYLGLLTKLSKKLAKEKDAKLIGFDFFSYFVVRNISFFNKQASSFIRCGGRNPKYSPFSKTVFSFSKENYDYYLNDIRFENSKLFLIPNRVEKLIQIERTNCLKDVVLNDYPIILRIGRFVPNYEEVNDSALALSRFLNQNEIKHNLVFIGYPDNESSPSFKKIKSEAMVNKSVYLLDEKKFTSQGSKFLQDATLIIGTGRGAMEAIVESKPLAIFAGNASLPIIVDSNEIFEIALSKNFSKRVLLKNISDDEIKFKLIAFFSDENYKKDVFDFQNKQKRFFDIDLARATYLNAFQSMQYDHKIRLIDFFKHLKIFVFKLYYISTRKVK